MGKYTIFTVIMSCDWDCSIIILYFIVFLEKWDWVITAVGRNYPHKSGCLKMDDAAEAAPEGDGEVTWMHSDGWSKVALEKSTWKDMGEAVAQHWVV